MTLLNRSRAGADRCRRCLHSQAVVNLRRRRSSDPLLLLARADHQRAVLGGGAVPAEYVSRRWLLRVDEEGLDPQIVLALVKLLKQQQVSD